MNCEWQRLGVGVRVREGWGRAPSLPATPLFFLAAKPRNHLPIIIIVVVLVTLATVAAIAYSINRQRKIKKYKLQEAQKAEALKLKLAATPP